MNDRERWIVYPLLFLALGAALRDKLAKQTRADQIVCSQLYLVDSAGRHQATLTGNLLTFEPGGRNNGLVQANAINADGLYERDQPIHRVVAQQLWQPIMQLFMQFRSGQMPNLKVIPQRVPLPEAAPPAEPIMPEPEPDQPDEESSEPPGAA